MSADNYTDESGNFWTMDELLADLDRGDYLYLTPKMCADLAQHLRRGPSDETRNAIIEECAKKAEQWTAYDDGKNYLRRQVALDCAHYIRELKRSATGDSVATHKEKS